MQISYKFLNKIATPKKLKLVTVVSVKVCIPIGQFLNGFSKEVLWGWNKPLSFISLELDTSVGIVSSL